MSGLSLWNEFQLPLIRFVSKRINQQEDVEDLVQNIFLKITNHIQELKDTEKLQSWIYQIARNAIIDYYRKDKSYLELPENLPSTVEPVEQSIYEEISDCIRPLINNLPEKYKWALEYTELNGHSHRKLSDELGISISGAKSRVQRGREKLKSLLISSCKLQTDAKGTVISSIYTQENANKKSFDCC